MANSTPVRINTITELHRLLNLPAPLHPLISIVDYAKIEPPAGVSAVFDFYSMSLKRGANKLTYGQQVYDFDEGFYILWRPTKCLRPRKQ